MILIHGADVQDRDGAPAVLKAARFRFPWLRHVFADGGYAGDKLRQALKGSGEWVIEIIRRSDRAKGFEVLPRRWVVERTLAWPLPPIGQRLGNDNRKLDRLGLCRQHSPHDQTPGKVLLLQLNF